MIKLIAFLKRKPGMTMEQFKVRWVDEHTRISSKLPGLLGYYININVPNQPSNLEPNYDGTAELWWNSVEEMEASFASEIGAAAGKDADEFCEMRFHLYTTEYTIIPFKGHP
ncbi:MAG: EthD family reductase [Anaerolineae bacterium]|nr:EthD family reductase [Anaerolineae bacterium]